MNALLLKLIRHFEGLRLKPYLCPAGVATCGYGSTGPDIKMGMPPWTLEQAEERLQKDAAVFLAAAKALCPQAATNEARIAALADFAYNLGATRLAGSTLRKRVAAGDWEAAGEELMKWVRGGGRVLPGLVARRAAERKLLVEGAA